MLQESTQHFNMQPILRGPLLTLRPLEISDYEALYSAASDPLIWEQHPEPDRHKRHTFDRFFESGIKSRGALVAIDGMNGEIIGSSRYLEVAKRPNCIEIGYTFLKKSYWGGKYNFEMKKLMLNHAFENFAEVVFFIGETNYRSQRAVEKLGATLLERFTKISAGGAETVSAAYVLKLEEWRLLTRAHS